MWIGIRIKKETSCRSPKMCTKRADIIFEFISYVVHQIKFYKNYKQILYFQVNYLQYMHELVWFGFLATFHPLDPDPYGGRCRSRIRIRITTNADPHHKDPFCFTDSALSGTVTGSNVGFIVGAGPGNSFIRLRKHSN